MVIENNSSKSPQDNNIVIEAIFAKVATRYEAMLTKFRAYKPGSSLLEQNLITILSHEFLTEHPDGLAFSEIPFINDKDANKWSSRLDGYLATKNIAYLVEAKGDLTKSDLFKAIDDDLARIDSQNLENSFLDMAKNISNIKNNEDRNYNIPTNVKGLIIAHTWSKETKDNWLKISSLPKTQHKINLQTNAYPAGKYGSKKTCELFILTGVTSQNIW